MIVATVRQVGRSCFIPLDGTGVAAGDLVEVTLRPIGTIVLTRLRRRRQRRRSAGR